MFEFCRPFFFCAKYIVIVILVLKIKTVLTSIIQKRSLTPK